MLRRAPSRHDRDASTTALLLISTKSEFLTHAWTCHSLTHSLSHSLSHSLTRPPSLSLALSLSRSLCSGHTQWFYFMVAGMASGQVISLHNTSISPPHHLYITSIPPSNSSTNLQWTPLFQSYKFNLVNFSKTGSLYNDGMKPLMFCSATRYS